MSSKYSLKSLPGHKPGNAIPAFFFAHGSPALMTESGAAKSGRFTKGFEGGPNGQQANFLRQFGPFLLETYKPKGIVVFSAHWEVDANAPILITDNTEAWQMSQDALYYDYYGFPDPMYQLRFQSKPDPELSQEVAALLSAAGINNSKVQNKRGFDHGVYIPFKLMFGDKLDVPLVEVGQYVNPEANLKLGSAIASLAKEGYLILCGGLTIHTFKDWQAWDRVTADPGYDALMSTLVDAHEEEDLLQQKQRLLDITTHPYFRKAHPTIEHFTPLYIAAGVGQALEGQTKVVSNVWGAQTAAYGVGA
ncbi:Extradiol ring-cleavage dioxygenase, class III enzyme, subunit B [Protomyces lactucae-debilis]|uniref:Extradiol ring-cleavage dioxygenase, class III enzyme, subunit B n=1 Tax=Protomyces lactucae-debilis TaxID=2754530 RepID=A0A1Y2FIW7_PROLT|nr:Extradiol ring-cleavage dioxygenase, class III enzyme, subunit B [Protomyces lactucae-debilis]ORY83888.1 Extradiol ring-cleavage dioxygenase, class III enzyme, subunit B [Protomyces lactucae-debilis]